MTAAHPARLAGAPPARRLRSGSLCAGYGGLDLAVMAVLGARLAWCAESGRHAAAVLAARYPGVPNLGDITALDWAAVPPVDLITAGWPCQDISYSGPGAGITKGTRSGLWLTIAAGLRQLRPAYVFLENVAALRTRGLGKSSPTWPRSGMTRNGCACALPTPEPATAATASSSSAATRPPGPGLRLLPTPVAGAFNDGESVESWLARRDRQKKSGRNGNGHQSGKALDAAARTLTGPGLAPGASRDAVAWGDYEPAIRRREHVLGHPAPPPAEPGSGGRTRLSAAFAEWLMGIPHLVTGVPGLPRTAQLRIIGNGVVPQQAAAALRLLIQDAAAFPSDPGLAGEEGQEIAA